MLTREDEPKLLQLDLLASAKRYPELERKSSEYNIVRHFYDQSLQGITLTNGYSNSCSFSELMGSFPHLATYYCSNKKLRDSVREHIKIIDFNKKKYLKIA